MKKVRSCALAAATLVLLAALPLRSAAALRVATASTYPPYEFLNEKGELDGFDREFTEEVGRRLGEEIEWHDTGLYDMVIPELLTDRADVIAAGMSATPIRAKRVLFSIPYVPTMSCFISAPSVNIESFADLKGLRCSVPVGTTHDVYMSPRAEEYSYEIKLFSNMEECVWDIVTGRSDFTLMDIPVADAILENPNFKGKVRRGADIELTNAGKAFAVKPGNVELKEKLDAVINEMKADGSLDALRKKWGL